MAGILSMLVAALAVVFVTRMCAGEWCNNKAKRPEKNGMLLSRKIGGAEGAWTYLIMDGCGHGIPSWDMFFNVFSHQACIHEDPFVEDYCICDPLDETAQIGGIAGEQANYLWSNNLLRWITKHSTLAKYCMDERNLQVWPANTVKDVPKAHYDLA